MNPRGKPRVAPNVLKSDLAFVSQQCSDGRRYRMRGISAAEINAQRSAMGGEVLDVKYLEAMLACETIDRDEAKSMRNARDRSCRTGSRRSAAQDAGTRA